MDNRELKKVLRKVFLSIFPEFGGYHFPIRAKVVKVHESGGQVREDDHRYSVDVQPLKSDGSVDDSAPVIPDVEIPIWWAGPARGVFCLPVVGSIVRVGFYYYEPAYPYVDAILPQGFNIPEHPTGSLIIQHSDGKRFEITPTGEVLITMDTTINGNLTVSGAGQISGSVKVGESVDVSGSISATGSIMDGGGNSNHHKH
jgi:hypothetical protein